ncbi:PAS domain-containing protein [Methanocella arvoryzae]|uniref:histidine kinase n=1 Tax=Methanocella arvoryzae (strain DSM 22066 / NBRC 105507 / MRE50) TaxID=351160 RepID=Q0W102_METAR|nr:PAS domain-containing sensor histidine kinase [Methanocella arvoryzae]CAJ37941.1 putative signal transduction histidine kinase [Methanocella arvoryzae MRE50]
MNGLRDPGNLTEDDFGQNSRPFSRELLQMVMDNIPQRIFWKDRNSVYLGCNKHFAIAAGVGTPDQIVGKTDYDLAWTREEADAFRRDDREVMDNNQPKYHIIEPQLQADGTRSWLDTNKIPLHDRQGNVIGILGTYEDITDRLNLEEKLRLIRERLEKAQQVAHVGNWEVDLVTEEMYWSDETFRIFGFDPETAKPDYDLFISAVHPESRERVVSFINSMMVEHKPSSIDFMIVRPDGSVRYISSHCEIVCDEAGKPVKLFGINQDITDRKKVEIVLKKREADLLFSQKIAHIGTWRWDSATGEHEWSDEFYRILGMEPGIVKPNYNLYLSMIHPGDRERVNDDMWRALEENRPSSLDYRIIRPDGTLRYVHVESVRIILDEGGRPIGNFGTIQDITDRKQVEISLEDAKVQAEMYLDLMGHDINNMNQVAMGFLEIALEVIGSDHPAAEYILKPLESLKNSSRLIQRVKKLQQTREEGLPLREMNVQKTLIDVLQLFSDIPGRQVTILTDIGCDCTVTANDLLRDVFENLIGNSIKHSVGPVTINVRAEQVKLDHVTYCRISVEDNGPGIPDKLKKSIFERFGKGAKKASGRGIGLYLVNSLVELYNGEVWVEDRVPGDYTQGAKFVILLPTRA